MDKQLIRNLCRLHQLKKTKLKGAKDNHEQYKNDKITISISSMTPCEKDIFIGDSKRQRFEYLTLSKLTYSDFLALFFKYLA